MSRKYDEDFIEYLPQIRNAANKLADKFGNVFIIDELVNEAWIRGRNSNRPNKSQFVQRAAWDMRDYVRSIFGRTESRYKKRPLFLTNCESAKNPANSWEHVAGRSMFDGEYHDKNLLRLENDELIKILLNQTLTQNLEAMVSYYLEGNDLVETGELIGRNQSTVYTYLKRGRQRCFEIVKDMGLEHVNI